MFLNILKFLVSNVLKLLVLGVTDMTFFNFYSHLDNLTGSKNINYALFVNRYLGRQERNITKKKLN